MAGRPRPALLLALAGLAAVPWVLPSDYYLRLTNVALVYALLALSLNIVLGYAGQLALGHAGFFGIGAYTSALVTLGDQGLPFWAGLAAAGVVTGLAGLLLGIPTLRLKSHYLALATLGFGEIMRHIFFNWREVTRGMDGIAGIRPPSLYFWTVATDRGFFYLIAVALGLAMLFSYRLERSKFGRAFMALRDAEVAAGAAGINVTRAKVLAFTLSATLAGLAGSFYAHLMTYISPDVFVFDVSAAVLSMLLVGGIGSVGGAVFGGLLLTCLPELLRFSRTYYMLLYACGIVAIVVFVPAGAAGLLQRYRQRPPGVARRARPEPAVSRRPSAAALATREAGWRPAPARTAEGPVLQVHGLTKRFGGVVAVDSVDLTVMARQIHALIGPNGSGKTTLLNVVSGIYGPDGGTIDFCGRPIGGENPWAITAAGIARTFQTIRLFPSMTVRQNVMVARWARTDVGLPSILLGLPGASREEAAIRRRAAEIIDFVGLADRLDALAGSLPHEEQRLVEIARALATDPSLLMLDEPAAGMNPAEAASLIERILRLRDAGLTILLIEHNMQLVMRIADHVSVLDFGRKIAEGAPSQVQNNSAVIEAYLGSETMGAVG